MLYVIVLCLTIAINIFMLVALFESTFSIWSFLSIAMSAICLVFSISYALAPKSNLARQYFTKIVLVLYAIGTAVFVCGVFVAFLIIA